MGLRTVSDKAYTGRKLVGRRPVRAELGRSGRAGTGATRARIVLCGVGLCALVVTIGAAFVPGDSDSAGAEAGAPGTVREVAAYRTEQPPSIDGRLDDAAWATAAKADAVLTAFGFPDDFGPVADDVVSYVTYDEQALYIAVRNASVTANPRRPEPYELEVMLDPGHFHAVGGWLWIGSDGTFAQSGFHDLRGIVYASNMTEDGWVVELAIPFIEWGGMPLPGDVWGFNIGGTFGSGGERPTWQPTFGPYAQPGRWGHVRFAGLPSPPSVDGGPTTVGQGSPSVRAARAFRLDESPRVDGTIDDTAWAEIARSGGVVGGFVRHEGDRLAEVPSFAAVGYDAERLYVYVRTYRVSDTALIARSGADGSDIWNDDQVEVMLAPGGARDGLWVAANSDGDVRVRGGRLWGDVDAIEVATRVEDAHWTVEMSIPFAALGTEAPPVDDVWRFNIGGHRVFTDEWPTWQPTGGPYEWVTRWGRLQFVELPS